MALSAKAKKRLEVAMCRRTEALEVIAAIDSNGSGPAAAVALLGTTTNIPTVSATLSTSGGNTYSDAAVKTAIDGAGNTLRVAAEARLDAVEAKLDAVIAALKAASLML